MIPVKELKQYLDQCPEDAEVKIGIRNYESRLADILKSPINDERVLLVDESYLEDCKEV